MKIGDLLSVYDGYVVVKCLTQRSTRTVVDSRKTDGNIPWELMDKTVYDAYIEQNFYDDELALTIAYEEV